MSKELEGVSLPCLLNGRNKNDVSVIRINIYTHFNYPTDAPDQCEDLIIISPKCIAVATRITSNTDLLATVMKRIVNS